MEKRLSVYMKYGEKADTCSIFGLSVQIVLKCVQLE